MGHKRGKLARFEDGVKAMSAHEREALRRAMQAAQEDPAMLSRITAIAAARGEAVRKRSSDRRTDAARRTLVGSRAVSYTHLDVYKRQALDGAGPLSQPVLSH